MMTEEEYKDLVERVRDSEKEHVIKDPRSYGAFAVFILLGVVGCFVLQLILALRGL